MASSSKMKQLQGPLDNWSTKEKLALASSVFRSGDQNWVSVIRAIKPFIEDEHPADWFSQKNCALQYAALLDNIETPKRKRGERSDVDTPGLRIVRRLSIERIEELKQKVLEEQTEYKKLKHEIESVKAGLHDDNLEQMIVECEAAEKELTAEESAHGSGAATEEAMTPPDADVSFTATDSAEMRVEPGVDSPSVEQKNLEDSESVASDAIASNDVTPTKSQKSPLKLYIPSPAKSPQKSSSPKALSTSEHIAKIIAEEAQKLKMEQLAQSMHKDAGRTRTPERSPYRFNKSPSIPTTPPLVDTKPTLVIHTTPCKPKTPENMIQVAFRMDNDSQHAPSPGVQDLLTVSSPQADPSLPIKIVASRGILITSKPTSQSSSPVRSAGSSPVKPHGSSPVLSQSTSPLTNIAPTLSKLLGGQTAASTNVDGQRHISASSGKGSSVQDDASDENDVESISVKDEDPENALDTMKRENDEVVTESINNKAIDNEVTGASISNRVEAINDGDDVDSQPCSPGARVTSTPTSPSSNMTTKVASTPSSSKRGRVGRPRNSQSGSRITRRSLHDDEMNEVTTNASDVDDTSDDDLSRKDTPRTNAAASKVSRDSILPLGDFIPNSPASLSHCSDTEDEKAYRTWKKSIMLVYRAAANHKNANVFVNRVTNDIAPGYEQIVHRPMDLREIKKNVESGVIRTTNEFQRDMMLMFTNAIMYNSSSHDVYQMAVEMYADVIHYIEQYLHTQMLVQTNDHKPQRISRRSETSDREDESKRRQSSSDTPESAPTKKRKTRADDT